jgi:NAD(P)-dependent dehydrogenase (short-subunit alcohol dehydrogenase family)
MDLGLAGRTVIVTGGTGGIGRHLVRQFAAEGAHVVLTYHEAQHDAELLAKEIGNNTRAVRHDMSDPDAAPALVNHALDWTGRIDVLVNNAGHWGSMAVSDDSRFEAVEDWQSLFRINAEGAIRLSRATAPIMRDQKWGRMVHISSTLAVGGAAGAEYYAAAKAALHGFSRSAAFSLGRDGDILSNVVMLGLTRTDTNTAITDAAGDHYSALAPIGRLLDAEGAVRPIVFLSSTANSGITGQVISVSGGV